MADQVRDEVWLEIVKGRSHLDELADSVQAIDEPTAHAIARHLLQARRDQIASMPTPPTTRLARADFTCCQNCGSTEIWDEMDSRPEDWLGYDFFHTQDTDRLLKDGATYLSYGVSWPHFVDEAEFSSWSDEEYEQRDTAKNIELVNQVLVPTLARYGIGVEWNQSTRTRILVTNADWFQPV